MTHTYGVETTTKQIKQLAEQLGAEQIGIELTLDEWLKYRDTKAKSHTRIAYSKSKYGVAYELFYDKTNHQFILV